MQNRTLAIAALSAIALAYVAGLTQSPGFSGDEAYVLEPAWTLATTGTLAAPGYGPAHHHDEAWMYQAPLHVALYAAMLRVLPLQLGALRMVDVLLALACGAALLVLARQEGASWPAATLGLAALLADPLTMERARLVRFDFLGMLLFILALTFSRRALVSGLLAGLAVSSYAGYLVLAPAALFWVAWPRQVRPALLFAAGWLAGVAPFALRIIMHRDAFDEQFVWLAHALAGPPLPLWEHVKLEALKYVELYRYAPVFPLLAAVALWKLRGKSRPLALALLCLGAVTFTSGHHPWYHLVVLPSLALCIALAFPEPKPAFIALLIAIGVAPRLYASWRNHGRRDPLQAEAALAQLIPDGARVHGDYRLWLIAHRRGWQFTTQTYERDSAREVLAEHPRYLVERPEEPTRVHQLAPREFKQITQAGEFVVYQALQ